jgi:hypothetical protein
LGDRRCGTGTALSLSERGTRCRRHGRQFPFSSVTASRTAAQPQRGSIRRCTKRPSSRATPTPPSRSISTRRRPTVTGPRSTCRPCVARARIHRRLHSRRLRRDSEGRLGPRGDTLVAQAPNHRAYCCRCDRRGRSLGTRTDQVTMAECPADRGPARILAA